MSPLLRVSVRTRQLWMATVGALTVLACIAVAIWVSRELTRHSQTSFVAKDVVADILPPPMYLIEMRLVLSRALETTMSVEQATKELTRLRKEYDDRVAWWRAHPPFGLEVQLMGVQHREAQAFMADAQDVMRHLTEGDHEAATRALLRADTSYLRHRAGVDETVKAGTALAEQSMAAFQAHAERTTGILVVLGLASISLLLALAWAIARSLLRPLAQAVSLAEAVADGDLTRAQSVQGHDETAALLHSLNQMREQLARTVHGVREACDHVAGTSHQIAVSNLDLRDRTQQHQQELQSASDSLASVTEFVLSNARSAETARDRAQGVHATAERGLQAMRDLAGKMGTIAGSSRKVGDIVGLIESIAFQTNLLALNAAVEAARAGEQGKGFAVVASEVRQLASRSSAASKDIRDLVQASAHEIGEGEAYAVVAHKAIEQMVAEVGEMSHRVGDIWETTFAQSSGINLLVETMRTLANNSAANVTLVVETAQLADDLQFRSGALAESVDRFRLPAAG